MKSTPILVALLALGCAQESESIGPRGGTLVSDDGKLTVDVYEDALDREVEVVLTETSDCDGLTDTCYLIDPPLMLGLPALVTFDYADENIGDTDPRELTVAVQYDADWQHLPDRLVDEEDETVSGKTVYLSSFAVMERH